MNLDRLSTDFFDLIASVVGKMESSKTKTMPDLSGITIDHLMSEEDMADPAKFYKKNETVPHIDFKRVARAPFVDIYDGEFPSPIQTAFPENNTVYVKHYRLREKKKNRPCVVMINGLYVNGNFYFDWWCWRFAAWGMDSALITMPWAQQRVPEGSYCGQLTIIPDTAWTLLSLRQSFYDTQLFVNWLKANGAGKVGLFGVSYGALLAGIFVCQADNADFSIMGMPPMDIVDIMGNWDFAAELRERESRGEMTMLTDPRIPALFNMGSMRPQCPTKNIFIAQGLFDHLVKPESINDTARAWGGLPWLRGYPTGHINTFALNFRFIEDARKFVHKEIL